MAALTARGEIPEAASTHLQGLYVRGHQVQDWYASMIERATPVVREHPVSWGDGWTAHVDLLVPEWDRKHVEIKSTTAIDKLPGCGVDVGGVKTTSAVLQVVGGAAFDPEGGVAEVVTVSPVDLQTRSYPVTLTDDLVGAAKETAQIVTSAVRTGELPPRPCKTPADGIARFCPHRDVCFEGWQPDDPIQLHAEVADLAEQLVDVDGQLRVTTGREKELKEQRDGIRDQLRGWLTPGKTYQVDGVELKRIDVKGRETFSLKDALAAGAVSEEQTAPFVRYGQPSERWTASLIDQPEETS
jgi:hypothetical protein